MAPSVVASIASSAPSFAGPRFYGTTGFTHSVAIGDLNGDGKPDLATANGNEYAPTVSVFMNRGAGRFRARRDYEAGRYVSYSVAIGDLNGDGKPDLVTANSCCGVGIPSTVSVLLNRGDGSFRATVEYGTGGGPNSVAIGDLNGDGRPDLATANSEANTVSVLMNTGDGSLRAKVDYGTGPGPESVAVGDLNGDSKLDLVSANCGLRSPDYLCRKSNTVSVLLNRGDGSFQTKVDFTTGRNPDSVAIGDLNGDGKPDLVTANVYAFTVSVLANRGDGSFQAKRDYEAGDGPVSVAIGDLNGDGKPELAVAIWGFRPQFNSGVSVLANATGLCGVPSVKWKTLRAAKSAIARADCRVGKIRRAYSTFVKRGRVISQKPGSGRVLPIGGKVSFVLSRGRKR